MRTLPAALAIASILAVFNASSQELVKVSQHTWAGLSPHEQETIQKRHIIEMVGAEFFGIIIDNQGINESTPGTNSGAALGGTLGQAAYIDHALKGGNNYSAKTQLGVAILGSVLGATLDKPAAVQYHFRYALKMSNGDIKFIDVNQNNAFRYPVGLCVSVPGVAPIDQSLCSQTSASIKNRYLEQNNQFANAAPFSPVLPTAKSDRKAPLDSSGGQINCKIGLQAPVKTTLQTCSSINGVQLQ